MVSINVILDLGICKLIKHSANKLLYQLTDCYGGSLCHPLLLFLPTTTETYVTSTTTSQTFLENMGKSPAENTVSKAEPFSTMSTTTRTITSTTRDSVASITTSQTFLENSFGTNETGLFSFINKFNNFLPIVPSLLLLINLLL